VSTHDAHDWDREDPLDEPEADDGRYGDGEGDGDDPCIGPTCINPSFEHTFRECFTVEDCIAWEQLEREEMRRERWPRLYRVLDGLRAGWRRLTTRVPAPRTSKTEGDDGLPF